MTLDEMLKKIVPQSLEKFFNHIDGKVPDTGKFQPHSLRFNIPVTPYMAKIVIENSGLYENKRVIKVLVYRRDTDKAYTHFYKHLTMEETKEYLKSEKAVEEVINSIRTLMDEAEKDWD